MTECGWPRPVRCESGNGAHLLYAIDRPNDEEIRVLIEMVLKQLAVSFDVPEAKVNLAVFNASRITSSTERCRAK